MLSTKNTNQAEEEYCKLQPYCSQEVVVDCPVVDGRSALWLLSVKVVLVVAPFFCEHSFCIIALDAAYLFWEVN